MPWREGFRPVRMERVAVVGQTNRMRAALDLLGRLGVVELDVASEHADLDELLAGTVQHGPVSAALGWCPQPVLTELRTLSELDQLGAAVVPLPRPAGLEPPTLLGRHGVGSGFDMLVSTYATVPYRDIDPTVVAGLAYVVMFGMMFGDAGHGALLVIAGLLARARWWRFKRLAGVWLFLVGAGLSATGFGALYGEFFGPTGLPVLWLAPLEQPVPLLLAGVGLGAVLLGLAFALGTLNRWREGGWGYALYSRSGIAGSLLFAGLGLSALGVWRSATLLTAVGALVAVTGLVLAFVGLLIDAGGGGAGVAQAVVELVDLVIRLGSNLVSFARLAAFGMTHAAIGWLVWVGAVGLWRHGPGAVAAVLVFLLGNAVGFALELLVAGIQALRLEYYELFSRVFAGEGRRFRPWRLPASASPAPGPSPSDPDPAAETATCATPTR